MSDGLNIPDKEKNDFILAVQTLRRLRPSFHRFMEDLDLEQTMGFQQLGVVDFSELYRLMHPEYLRHVKENDLLTVHLMFKSDAISSQLQLISPYYYELINHLKMVSTALKNQSLQRLLGDPQIMGFMEIMGKEKLEAEDRKRLSYLLDNLQTRFLDLILPTHKDKIIADPINELLQLVSQRRIHVWNDPKISYEKLLRSEEFRSVLDALDYLRPDRPIANRIDALAASFVHEANRILIKEKKYVVLITGSPVPLLTYGLHPFKHQYIQFPIERNLEYVAIRIYLFTKYKERKEIIGRLNQILPYIDQIVEVGTPIEQLLNSTPRIEMLPPDVVSNMESLSQARKVSEEIIEDMSQILMAIAKDIRVSIEARVRFIQSSMPASLFALFKEDEPALASHIRDTLKTIEKVFLQLEKEIGVIDFADKAAILGKQLEFQVSSVLSKLLSAMGFEVKAGVAYNFADLPYVTEKPGIVATKDGSVFIFCLKILLDEKSTPWSAGNEIKATSDILKATNFFGTSAVNPVLVLINAKSRKEIEDFSRAIGVRIITLTDQQIEKILNNKDLREARELGRELLRLEQ